MKKYQKLLLSAMCIAALGISAGTFMKVNAASGPAAVAVAGQPVDLTYAAEKALPAVVQIKHVQNSKTQTVRMQRDPFEEFFSDPFGFFGNPQGGTRERQIQTPKKTATGSGVIISPDGYIVTNNHMVEGADELTVTLNDNREFSARIVGTDKTTDLALIKINETRLPYLTFANSDSVRIGEWVLAIGNPMGLNSTVTAGIISAKARQLSTGRGNTSDEVYLQTDAAVNSGNSGGALVNASGKLVGINTAIASGNGYYTGYSFAIPSNIVKKICYDLEHYGVTQQAYLGVSIMELNATNAKELNLNDISGIYVAEVSENGAAAQNGFQEGDVITHIDNTPVNSLPDVRGVLKTKSPGDKVKVVLVRDNEKITKNVTLLNSKGTTEKVEK